MARADANLSACALSVKRYDRDRWFCSLFAAESRREDLFALYAFNTELAGVAEKVSEPMLGDIRLQWWREAIDGIYAGTPRQHEVVLALAMTIGRHDLGRALFDRLIDGRARDLDKKPPDDLDALESYAHETSAPLARLALQVLGAQNDVTARAADAGATGFAITGLLRATPYLLREGRVLLPTQIMVANGLSEGELRTGQMSDALSNSVKSIASRADQLLGQARALSTKVPRRGVPALLPVALAKHDLKRLSRLGFNVFDPRVVERTGGRLVSATWRALAGRY